MVIHMYGPKHTRRKVLKSAGGLSASSIMLSSTTKGVSIDTVGGEILEAANY